MNTWAFESIALDPDERANDGKNWARLIIKRKAQGGQVPSVSVELAREALGLAPEEEQRQPGEEG